MNNKLFSRLKDLARKENRARLAVLLGAAATLLILLSELFRWLSGYLLYGSTVHSCNMQSV